MKLILLTPESWMDGIEYVTRISGVSSHPRSSLRIWMVPGPCNLLILPGFERALLGTCAAG